MHGQVCRMWTQSAARRRQLWAASYLSLRGTQYIRWARIRTYLGPSEQLQLDEVLCTVYAYFIACGVGWCALCKALLAHCKHVGSSMRVFAPVRLAPHVCQWQCGALGAARMARVPLQKGSRMGSREASCGCKDGC